MLEYFETFAKYQEVAQETAVYGNPVWYPTLGLAGEAERYMIHGDGDDR